MAAGKSSRQLHTKLLSLAKGCECHRTEVSGGVGVENNDRDFHYSLHEALLRYKAKSGIFNSVCVKISLPACTHDKK